MINIRALSTKGKGGGGGGGGGEERWRWKVFSILGALSFKIHQ